MFEFFENLPALGGFFEEPSFSGLGLEQQPGLGLGYESSVTHGATDHVQNPIATWTPGQTWNPATAATGGANLDPFLKFSLLLSTLGHILDPGGQENRAFDLLDFQQRMEGRASPNRVPNLFSRNTVFPGNANNFLSLIQQLKSLPGRRQIY